VIFIALGNQFAVRNLGGRGDHELAEFLAQLALQAGQLGVADLAGLGEDVGRLGDGLLAFGLGNLGGGRTGVLDDLVRLRAGLGQDLLGRSLRLGEFDAALLGIRQALGNALTALLEHVEDRRVREFLQRERDDDEQDDLRDQQLPGHAELVGEIDHRVPGVSGGEKEGQIHIGWTVKQSQGAEPCGSAPLRIISPRRWRRRPRLPPTRRK